MFGFVPSNNIESKTPSGRDGASKKMKGVKNFEISVLLFLVYYNTGGAGQSRKPKRELSKNEI